MWCSCTNRSMRTYIVINYILSFFPCNGWPFLSFWWFCRYRIFTEGAKALLVTFISLLINLALAQLFPALPNPHSTPLPSHCNGLPKMTPSTIGVSNGSAADKPCSLGLFYKAVKILSSSTFSSYYLTMLSY